MLIGRICKIFNINSFMIIKYYLAPGNKESTIRVCFYENKDHQFKVHTNFRIEQKYWDKKHQRAKKSMLGFDSFNEELDLYKLDLLKQILKGDHHEHGNI